MRKDIPEPSNTAEDKVILQRGVKFDIWTFFQKLISPYPLQNKKRMLNYIYNVQDDHFSSPFGRSLDEFYIPAKRLR